MKHSELPGARRLYRLTNRALAQIRELWQYAGEDELPPDSLLRAQVEAFRILHIVPLSAKRQFQLFCSEHFPGLADILQCFMTSCSARRSVEHSTRPPSLRRADPGPKSSIGGQPGM